MIPLPKEILIMIYEFDPTYHEIFKKTLVELESKSLKEGDEVMLEENLVDPIFLPKYKCFQKYTIERMVPSRCGSYYWVELNNDQFFRIYELKKVSKNEDGIEYYFSFLTNMYYFHHSRLLFDFKLNDIVEIDVEGFRGEENPILQYSKFISHIYRNFKVLFVIDSDHVQIDLIGKIKKKYLKLSNCDENYTKEFALFCERRNLLPSYPF